MGRSPLWRALAFIGPVTLPLLVLAPALRDGTRTFFSSPDARDQSFAWYQKMARAVDLGYLPLWDTDTLSGHSFAGDFLTGVLYPVNVLWLALFARDGSISL